MREHRPFRFKQFSLHQERSAMKVGTDAVVLGAYATAPTSSPKCILDVGGGTGIVALMLAQRYPMAHVDCVEIDPEAAAEARRNSAESPFASRVEVYATDYADFVSSRQYDLIVSNPPFFTATHTAAGQERTQARHIGTLTPMGLFARSKELLAEGGQITLICAVSTFGEFWRAAAGEGLALHHLLYLSPQPHTPAKRVVATWGMEAMEGSATVDYLAIEAERHCYTRAFAELTAPFYPDEYRLKGR